MTLSSYKDGKVHYFKGSARFEFRDISNNKKHQIETSDKESIIVDTIPDGHII